VLSIAGGEIQAQRRKVYTGSIIDRLAKSREYLTSEQLVTLAWLHLISFDNEGAKAAASAALTLDEGNGKARDLLRRVS
jgi:hypothetical protein